MWRRLRRIVGLSAADRAALAAAYLRLGYVDLALRLGRFRALAEDAPATPTGVERLPTAAEWRRIRRAAYWTSVAARHHLVPAQCLHRSLVLHRWLRGQGWPSALRIGVRKEGGALLAHAWVELAGEPVNDHPKALAGFAPLAGPLAWRLFAQADRSLPGSVATEGP